MSSIFDKLKNKNNKNFGNKDIFSSLGRQAEIEKPKEVKTLSGLNLPVNLVAIPHCFSQSAIYAPRSGDRNIISARKDLWSQGNNNIFYEGPTLDTKIDMQLMSIVLKAKDLQKSDSNIVKLKFKETMRVLGLNPHHPNSRTKFLNSINRHLEAKLYFSIGNEEEGFWRSFFLTEGTKYSYKKDILHIELGEIIEFLFKEKETGSFSIENMLISFALKSSYSVKLYSYFESNINPYPIKVSTILNICDKKIENGKKPTNNHRKIIKDALNELVSFSFLESWYFDCTVDKRDPLVVVKKKPKEITNKINKEEKLRFKADYLDE